MISPGQKWIQPSCVLPRPCNNFASGCEKFIKKKLFNVWTFLFITGTVAAMLLNLNVFQGKFLTPTKATWALVWSFLKLKVEDSSSLSWKTIFSSAIHTGRMEMFMEQWEHKGRPAEPASVLESVLANGGLTAVGCILSPHPGWCF